MDKRKTRSLVQKGFSIALTATMVAGSLPTAAIAETLNQDATAAITAGLGDVPSAATTTDPATTDAASTGSAATADESTQATTQLSATQAAQLLADSGSSSQLPDPTAMPEIADGTYTVNVETRDAANPSNLSMSANTVSREAKLVAKDGKITLTIDFKAWNNPVFGDDYLGGLYYYNKEGVKTPGTVIDTQKNDDGTPIKDRFSDILSTIGVTEYPDHVEIPLSDTTVVNNYFKLGVFVPVMESLSAGQGSKDALLNVDWTSLKSDVAPAYDSAYKIYYKGADATEQYVTGERASFTDKVHVVPQADGTYVVELTAKSLGNAGKLADVKVDGKAVPYTDNEDGSRTYQIPMADVKGTLDFTFGYTVSFGGREQTMEHPFQLVVDGGTYVGYTATKEFLDEQIASAKRKLAASKKDDAANEAYQKAIDAAQAVSDKQGATTAEYGKAVQDLDAASKTFNAAPDKPAAPTVEAGKVYTTTGTFYDETGTTESSSMKRFLNPTVEVRKAADGTYEVDVKTIDEGVTTAFGLSVSSGFDSTESDVVYSEAKGDNTVATYRLTGDDLSNIKLHVGYEAGNFKGSHNLILKVDAANVKEETVDKTALTDAIKAAPADKGSKTDEAFKTLSAAKDAAQKVADQADATTADVAAAVSALNKAVADFNASEDARPETGLEAGKTYSVPVAFHKTGTTDDSMSGAYFEPKATVVANEGGTYTVTLTTKLTADQKGWMSDLKVGGKAAETKQVDDNNVSFTFTVDDISNPITASVYVQPMGSAPSLDIQLDASKAEEVKPAEADKSKLSDAIASAKKVEQGSKTDEAFEALADAIAAAQKVADDESATQDAVNSAVDALNKAVETFKASADKPVNPNTVDTSKLQAAIRDADAIEQGNKTDDAYATLKAAVADAKKVLDTAKDQKSVDDAVTTLNKAVETFRASADKPGTPDVKVDKSKLDAAIKEANKVEQGDKTDEAWAALKDAITAAEQVNNDAKADQAKVDAAVTTLNKAVETFKASADAPKPADTSKLEEAIAEAKKVEQGKKTDEAWAAFQKAISDAQAVVDAKPTTDDQGVVNKATNALEVATKTFKDSADKPETPVEQVDKSKLNEAIESAKKVEQGKKTDAAFKALQAAISSAEAVAANDDADQATVDKATETLNAAVDTFNKSADMVEKPTTPTTTQKPATPNATNTTNGNKKLPQTSDPTSLVGIISAAVAGLSVAGIGIVSRMRGKRDDQ